MRKIAFMKRVAWVAGIIEGEGCIVVSKRNRPLVKGRKYPVRQFRLAVEMTDLDVLIKLKEILGQYATLRERIPKNFNPNHRRRYILCLTGKELASWLMMIYPFMGERRKKRIRQGLIVWRRMRCTWRHKIPRYTPLRIVA